MAFADWVINQFAPAGSAGEEVVMRIMKIIILCLCLSLAGMGCGNVPPEEGVVNKRYRDFQTFSFEVDGTKCVYLARSSGGGLSCNWKQAD